MPEMVIACGLVVLGLFLLFAGGELLVKGAVSTAKHLNLSEVFIGIVIIGFGTSLPETLTVYTAAKQGDAGLALGNVVGSNIANILLILAVALLCANASSLLGVAKERMNYLFMGLGMLVFTLFALNTLFITIPIGLLFLALIFGLMLVSWRLGASLPQEGEEEQPLAWPLATGAILIGFILLVGGAKALVSGATTVALALGVPELIIGLTLVAVGTSLPELAATIAAARHGKLALTVGNVLGSNLFNVLAATGLGVLGGPLATTGLSSSIIVMWLAALIMVPLFYKTFSRPRLLGVVMLLAYAAYIAYLAISGGSYA